jgi:hypothetical protein
MKNYLQVIDTETGRLLEADKPDDFNMIAVIAKDPRGVMNAITYSGGPLLFTIFAEDRGITIEKAPVTEDVMVANYFGRCALSQSNDLKAILNKELHKFLLINGTFARNKYEKRYLLTAIQSTSAGWRRADEILTSNGRSFDIRGLMSDAISASLPRNNLSWVGMYRSVPSVAPSKKEWLGVLLNKDVYVMEHDESSGEGYWPLVYNYRHPEPIEHARFVAPDTLVVVEAKSGRLVTHYFDSGVKKQILKSNMDEIIGHRTREKNVATPYWNWCLENGWVTMPSGVKIVGKSTWLDGERTITIEMQATDGTSQIVTFGNNTSCVKVSRDRSQLLVVNEERVLLYDLNAVVRTGSIDGNLVSAIQISQCSSAYFVGENTNRIMAASGTSVVMWTWNSEGNTWNSNEVYRGNSPVKDAEPSKDGKQIIILEYVGAVMFMVSFILLWPESRGMILVRTTNFCMRPSPMT